MKKLVLKFQIFILILLPSFASYPVESKFAQKDRIITIIQPFEFNKSVGFKEAKESTNYFCKKLKEKHIIIKTIDRTEMFNVLENLNIKSPENNLSDEQMLEIGSYLKSDFVICGRISNLDSLLVLTTKLMKIDFHSKEVFTVDTLHVDFDTFRTHKINELAKIIRSSIFKSTKKISVPKSKNTNINLDYL